MKTSIYIEDGTTQLVITPETEWEKNALNTMEGEDFKCNLFHGAFYDCRGGWIRQTAYSAQITDAHYNRGDHSLIIKVTKNKGEIE